MIHHWFSKIKKNYKSDSVAFLKEIALVSVWIMVPLWYDEMKQSKGIWCQLSLFQICMKYRYIKCCIWLNEGKGYHYIVFL